MKSLSIASFFVLMLSIQVNAQQSVMDTTVYFDFDKYSVNTEYEKIFEEITSLIKNDSTAWIEVSGHADIKGPKEYNQKLSLKRTETVIKKICKSEIDAAKVKGFHYGSSKPVASNNTIDGRKKNRRVEISIYSNSLNPMTAATPDSISGAKSKVVYSKIPKKEEELPLRTEIDVLYNQEAYAYLDNSHRTIVHTIREAEFIIDTNTFSMPVRSNLYKHEKVRMDFSEMDQKGEMLMHKLNLKSETGEVLDASYVLCLDLDSLKIAKNKKIDFLIPEQFVKGGTNIYYSEDHGKWKLNEQPKYDSFHHCYMLKMKNDGCFAVAKVNEASKPVSLVGKYNYKEKDAKLKEEPEFYFVYKNSNTIVSADSVSDGKFYFSGLKNGETGTIVGVVNNDGNLMYLAQDEISLNAHHSDLVHNHGHVKFAAVNHFEMERALLNLYKENF